MSWSTASFASTAAKSPPAPEVTRAERFIMEKLIYSTFREGYGIDQVNRTMTAGELINFLAQYDEDTPIYLSFDNGYTYGGITEERFEEDYGEDKDDE
jgi:hypothetical protein